MTVLVYDSIACMCRQPTGQCQCPEQPSEWEGLDADLLCGACAGDDGHNGGCDHHLCVCPLPQCVSERDGGTSPRSLVQP
jgi:hypothetical protein